MPLRPKAKSKAWRRKVGRPRVNQFADDLGISRREALNLMNKGRRRKDGGSNVLENSMNKMKGYNEGGAKRRSTDAEPAIKLTKKQKEELEALGYGDEPSYYDTSPRDMEPETKAMGGTMKAKGYAGGGSYCRGGGAAIQGTKFSGEF